MAYTVLRLRVTRLVCIATQFRATYIFDFKKLTVS